MKKKIIDFSFLHSIHITLFLRIIFTLISGFLIARNFYRGIFETFVFDNFLYFGLFILSFIITFFIFNFDSISFKKSKKRIEYLPSGIIVIYILITSSIVVHYNSIFNAPTLFRVNHSGDFNGVSIDFKENGTFILDNYCMGSDFSFGKYEIEGNTITILHPEKLENRLPETMSIQYDSNYNEYYLSPFESIGLHFRIVEDLRK